MAAGLWIKTNFLPSARLLTPSMMYVLHKTQHNFQALLCRPVPSNPHFFLHFLNTGHFKLFDDHKKEDETPAYVSFKRLRKILRAATYEFNNKQLRLCRSLCDTDKSGRVEFEELLDLFIYLKWLQVAFDRADTDKSNNISLDEVINALSMLGHNITPEKAKRVFSKVDIDRSDALDFAEFFEFTVEAKIDVRNLEYEDDGKDEVFDE